MYMTLYSDPFSVSDMIRAVGDRLISPGSESDKEPVDVLRERNGLGAAGGGEMKPVLD